MSNTNLNKKNLYAILTVLFILISGIVCFALFNGKEETSKQQSLEQALKMAANKFIEENNLSVDEESDFVLPAGYFVDNGLLDVNNVKEEDVPSIEYSSINISNGVTFIASSPEEVTNTIDFRDSEDNAPDDIDDPNNIFETQYDSLISNAYYTPSTATKNSVAATLIFSKNIEYLQKDVDGEFKDITEEDGWTLTETWAKVITSVTPNGEIVKVKQAVKTFENNTKEGVRGCLPTIAGYEPDCSRKVITVKNIDKVAPKFSGISNGETYKNSVNIHYYDEYSEDFDTTLGGVTASVKDSKGNVVASGKSDVNGGDLLVQLEDEKVETYTLEIVDTANNTLKNTVTFTIDNKKPVVNETIERYTNKSFSFTYTDDSDVSVSIKLNGEDVDSTSYVNGNTITIPNNVDSVRNDYEVILTDKVGNITEIIFTVDTILPTMSLVGKETQVVLLGGVYSEQGVTNISDNIAIVDNYCSGDKCIDGKVKVIYKLNGSEVNSIDSSAANTYVVTYEVKDVAGNIGTITRNVVVVNTNDLQALIDGIGDLNEEDYTIDSWGKLQVALKVAVDSLANPNDPNSIDLATAQGNLTTAKNNLVKKTIISGNSLTTNKTTNNDGYAIVDNILTLTFNSTTALASGATVSFSTTEGVFETSEITCTGLSCTATATVTEGYNGRVTYTINGAKNVDIDTNGEDVIATGTLSGTSDFELDTIKPVINGVKIKKAILLSAIERTIDVASYVTVTDNGVTLENKLTVTSNKGTINGYDLIIPANSKDTYVVTYNAEDNAGNKADSLTMTITIIDNQELSDLINRVPDSNNGEYPDGYFEDVTAKKDIIDDKLDDLENAETEEEINKAIEDLNKAKEDLKEALDKLNAHKRPVITVESFESSNTDKAWANINDKLTLKFETNKPLGSASVTFTKEDGSIIDVPVSYLTNEGLKYTATIDVPAYNGKINYSIYTELADRDIDANNSAITGIISTGSALGLTGESSFTVDTEKPKLKLNDKQENDTLILFENSEKAYNVTTGLSVEENYIATLKPYNIKVTSEQDKNISFVDNVLTIPSNLPEDGIEYIIKYNVSDAAGNSADEIIRTIRVINTQGLSSLIEQAERVLEEPLAPEYKKALQAIHKDALDALDGKHTPSEITTIKNTLKNLLGNVRLIPTISNVSISSSNANSGYAKALDTITVRFNSTAQIDTGKLDVKLTLDSEVTVDAKSISESQDKDTKIYTYTIIYIIPKESTYNGTVNYAISSVYATYNDLIPAGSDYDGLIEAIVDENTSLSGTSLFEVDTKNPEFSGISTKILDIKTGEETYDLLSEVSASDERLDGSTSLLTDIKVYNNSVSESNLIDNTVINLLNKGKGTYTLVYRVEDEAGNFNEKTISLTIVDKRSLKNTFDKAPVVDATLYDEDVVKEFESAKNNASNILNNTELDGVKVDQSMVDAAEERLQDVINSLAASRKPVISNVVYSSNNPSFNPSDQWNKGYLAINDKLYVDFDSDIELDTDKTKVTFRGNTKVADKVECSKKTDSESYSCKATYTVKPEPTQGYASFSIKPVSTNDIAGNPVNGMIYMIFDTIIPEIDLNGFESFDVEAGSTVQIDKDKVTVTDIKTDEQGNFIVQEYQTTASDSENGKDIDLTSRIDFKVYVKNTDGSETLVDSIDTSVIATYIIKYNVKDNAGNAAEEVIRTVNVVDTTAPVITISEDNVYSMEVKGTKPTFTATASDNYDGTVNVVITDDIDVNVVGKYTVTFTATDANGNVATEVREFSVVDTTKPVITLKGEPVVSVDVNTSYTDAGATASDNYDGDITASIVVSGQVDTTTVGTYTITYNVTDANGNVATQVIRTVHVVDKSELNEALTEAGKIKEEDVTSDSWTRLEDAIDKAQEVLDKQPVTQEELDDAKDSLTSVMESLAKYPKISGINIIAADPNDENNTSKDYAKLYDEITLTFISSEILDKADDKTLVTINNSVVSLSEPQQTEKGYVYTAKVSISSDYPETEVSYSIKPVTMQGAEITPITDKSKFVVDLTSPTIALNPDDEGNTELTLEVGTEYTELGATVSDNKNNDLTYKVVSNNVNMDVVGTYQVVYSASDKAGNPAENVIRTVNVVDRTAPVITIENDVKVVIVEKGETYTLPNVTAEDSYVGTVPVTNDADSVVNVNEPKDYTVTFTATDGTNPAYKTIIVRVLDLDILRNEENTLKRLEGFIDPNGDKFATYNENKWDYTEESWNAKQALIDELNNIIEGKTEIKAEEITQEFVNTKMNAIVASKLEPKELDKTEYNAQIDRFDSLVETDYTPSSWQVASSYRNQSISNIKLQSDLNHFTRGELKNSIDNLERLDLYDYATKLVQDFMAQYKYGDYEDSVYEDVINKLINLTLPIMSNHTAMLKSELDKEVQKLRDQIESARLPIDPTALEELKKDLADNYDEEDYTTDSWKAIQDLIKDAEKVVADNGLRSEFKDAMDKINLDNLVKIPNAIDVVVSSNGQNGFAKVGNTITVTFGGNVELDVNATTVKINGEEVTLNKVNGVYEASLTVDSSSKEGSVSYEIKSVGSDGLEGKTLTGTSESVVIDRTAPTVGFKTVILENTTIKYKQDYVVSRDDLTLDDTYTGIKDLDVQFNQVDVNTLGEQTITYTVTDLAGNPTTVTRKITVVYDSKPVISVENDVKEVTVEVGSASNIEVIDNGWVISIDNANGEDVLINASVTDTYDNDKNIPIEVGMVFGLDLSTIGDKTITLTATNSNGKDADSVEITVHVVDTRAPEITLVNPETAVVVPVGGTYTEPGYSAYDIYEGDITSKVQVTVEGLGDITKLDTTKVGDYRLLYNVMDGSENKAEQKVRIVRVVDNVAPVIELLGDNPMTVQVGEEYQEPGVKIIDNYDGNISSKVIVSGTVNTSIPGTYTLEYDVTDLAGNRAETVTRTVIVADTTIPTVDYEILNNPKPVADKWFGETIRVQIIGRDNSGVISDLQYQLVIDDVPGEWKSVESLTQGVDENGESYTYGTFPISNNSGNIKFNVRSVDGASVPNVSEEKLGGPYKLDVIAPSIDSTKEKGDYDTVTTWYKSAVTVNVKASDNASGVKAIMYAISKDAGQSWSEWSTVNGAKAQFTISDNLDTIMYKVKVVDNAGNESDEKLSSLIKIDTKKPVISVKYDGKTYTDSFDVIVEANKTNTFVNPEVTSDGGETITTTGSVDNSVLGEQTITYTTKDNAGNITTVVMTVTVKDNKAPEITLNGEEELTIKYGSVYSELGATAVDAYDGEVDVEVSGTVDTYKIGTYTITYTAKDSTGNSSTVTRKVNVVKTTTSEVIREGNKGEMYCVDGKDCYNTKVTDNNYVWYSGRLWRVIKVNADGTVKMVTEESVAGILYDDDSSTFSASMTNEWLSKEFYPELNNPSKIIAESNYCNHLLTNGSKLRFACKADSVVTAKVGLLTIDEYNILGGEEGYLNNGTWFFTMTPSGNQSVWVVNDLGEKVNNYAVTNPYAIRPVVTLKENITITSGDGSINNPYRLNLDNSGEVNSKLNARVSGEYVVFANQTWRIVEATGTQTKLIYDGYLMDGANPYKSSFGEFGNYNTTQGVGQYLNTTVLNTMFTSEERDLILDSRWYNNSIDKGENPRTTSLVSSGNYTTAKIGLPSVGELTTGGSYNTNIERFTVWAMNYNSVTVNGIKTPQWFLTSVGTSDYISKPSDTRGLKPVINLNPNLTIKSGDGTMNSPYILNY